ncbi:MAG TPA: GNAT family N-acetyltransferase [Longimicrobium sp.]|nr:GNAT family N-acetyltransferase [Longimicrobium sp.]
MLSPETLRALDAYWAGDFGCDVAGLRPSAPSVFPCQRRDGSRSVYVMEFGAAPVAQLSAELMDAHAARVRDVLAAGLDVDAAAWAGIFGDEVEAVIGPAALHYTDGGTLRPLPPSPTVRVLSRDDLPAAEVLRSACTPLEWEHGANPLGNDVVAGVFVGGELAALAGYEVWDGVVAHLSVVTHPAHRRRGHAAVSRVTQMALERGLLAQYRALESNTPSLAVAVRLGFQPYARSLAVRLRGA